MAEQSDLSDTSPHRLSQLFDVEATSSDLWSKAELGAVFRHQMNSRIADELTAVDPASGTEPDGWTRSDHAVETFDDLFQHPSPPLELLELVKDFAKRNGEVDGHLPREVAALLYLLAISAALVRCDHWMTTHDIDSLRRRLRWARSLPWVRDDLANLLEVAASRLDQ